MLTPHDYQQEIIDRTFDKLTNLNSLLIQSMTGSGKTVIMAFICKRWIEERRGKIVITCHRRELVSQTVATLVKLGIVAQSFTASSKSKHVLVDVYVTMVETLHRRLESNRFDTDGVTLVVSDEAHIRVHAKTYPYFPLAKIIAFTATPVLMKRTKFYQCILCKRTSPELDYCHDKEMEEWTKPTAMSQFYQDIIVGPNFDKLAEVGQLVPEVSFVKNYVDMSTLKTDSTGEYTTKSLDETYGNDDAVFNVLLNYEELCKGKRTMIFNSSTKVNLHVYEAFREKGYNVKMFDSVNDAGISRTQLVGWFNTSPDAILVNCSVFTTGFDSREVQAVIVNRSTKSLALWLQIVGRGGRSSLKIFKQDFILIDGGDNIAEFGEWSKDRDWEDIFWNGIGKPKPRKVDIEDVQDCKECGALYPKRESVCPFCGHAVEVPPPSDETPAEISESVLTPIREIPPPSGKHIYDYTKAQGENVHFAFRILQSRIVDMFIYYRVTRDQYAAASSSGELDRKVKKYLLPPYFFLIKKEDIQNGAHRTIDYMMNKTKEKIAKYYGE